MEEDGAGGESVVIVDNVEEHRLLLTTNIWQMDCSGRRVNQRGPAGRRREALDVYRTYRIERIGPRDVLNVLALVGVGERAFGFCGIAINKAI